MSSFNTVQIDGEVLDPATAAIPVSDLGFVRGVGVFEVIRAFSGVNFRIAEHLERLARSAAMFGLELPADDVLAAWCNTAAEGQDESVIRIMVTAGDDLFEGTPRVVVTSEDPTPQPAEMTLCPLPAPWHSDGADWELLRGKTLSYGNNYGAIRQAKLNGFDNALLIGRSGRILEGPTFSVGWVVEEEDRIIYETPAMNVGILDSITRQLAFDAADDAGLVFREVEVGLERLADALEFFVVSTLRDAISVTAVGDRIFLNGHHTTTLRRAMQDRTSRELAAHESIASIV